MHLRTLLARLPLFLSLLLLVSCDPDKSNVDEDDLVDDGNPDDEDPDADDSAPDDDDSADDGDAAFSLRSETTNFTRGQGGSGAQHVYVDRDPGFAEEVTLEVSGTPTGVTVSYEPTAVSGDVGVIHFAISETATTGDSKVTVVGTATGGDTDSIEVPLSILGASAEDVGVDASPLSSDVALGGSVTLTADLQWHGTFADDADVECHNLPTDVTCTFADNPVPVGQASTDLTIAVGSSATEGVHPIIVHAEAGTQAKASAILLVIGSGGSGSGSFAVRSEVTNFTINQDMNGSMTVYVDRTDGHDAAVTLAATAETGLNVTFEEAAPEGTSAVLILAVDSTGTTGDTTITVTGDDGSNTSTADFPVTVNPTAFDDFSLEVNTHSQELTEGGGNGDANIQVQWGGSFEDDVVLTCTPPTEISCTLGIGTVEHPNTDSAVTLSVNAGAASGVYPIQVEGVGDGISKLVSFQVIVP